MYGRSPLGPAPCRRTLLAGAACIAALAASPALEVPGPVAVLEAAVPAPPAQVPVPQERDPEPVRADVTPPEAHFGFTPGDDRRLATWAELTSYYERLARESARVTLDTLGSSTRGRPFVMLTITSEENQGRIDQLRDLQRRLSDPRTLTAAGELERLLERGRAVVLMTHGIHANEVGSAQVAARLAYRLAASESPDVTRILDEVVVLDIPSLNPDGTDWVSEWYMRWVGTEYEGAPLPWLYHYYTGHDNNRDWYAFTQVETRLAVERVHNVWRPHVVHDIHQMDPYGARIFFPPYVEPWEPNVDPALTAAVNALGSWMAARLLTEGKRGVVTHAIYDAYTPARAYSHYHAGARLLSETASARLASPDSVAPFQLRGGRGYDASSRSWNHPEPWGGGRWGLPEIVAYMESGAMALLDHAARNRRYWLETQHAIQRRAVEGWEGRPEAWVIPSGQEDRPGLDYLLRILGTGDVEVRRSVTAFDADGRRFPGGSWVVSMRQPYASFAQSLLEVQEYPEVRADPDGPVQRPYDVTAHTLPLLMGVDAVPLAEAPAVELTEPIPTPEFEPELPASLPRRVGPGRAGPPAGTTVVAPAGAPGDPGAADASAARPRIGIYKSAQEPMAAGWTRWLFDHHGLVYDTVSTATIRSGRLGERYDVLVLQSQTPASIREGWSDRQVPPEWAGGLGTEGSRALGNFVRAGGRLVAVEAATDFVIDLLGLRVSNQVERLPAADFYAPGAILRLDLEDAHPLASVSAGSVAAWFGDESRAFAVADPTVRVLARYGGPDPLLSGWIRGARYLADRPALLEADVGRGSVVLFGFQPNYRGQSAATWPLLFEAMNPEIAGVTAGGTNE